MHDPWNTTLSLLHADQIPVPAGFRDRIDTYLRLLAEATPLCGLVASRELPALLTSHVPDALSLAGPLLAADASGLGYLDVGSGGGLPAIPLLVLLPDLPALLVERNTRKAGFLQRVVGALQLSAARVVCGEFPAAVSGETWGVVTARAVERPEKILRNVLRALPAHGAFLCQSSLGATVDPEKFHVEHVTDAWTSAGLRRASLELIRPRPAP